MKRLLTIVFLLLSLTISAQRVIENPTFRAKGLGGLSLGIEKVVLLNDVTKLYMVYYHGGGFNINGSTRLVAGGKEYKVQSAEGIELNGPAVQKSQGEQSHFVLNFPPLDKDVDRFDFIEDYCDQCFKIFDIAITDQAAEEIRRRITVPDAVKNYAANIKDNGKSLEKQDFSMTSAVLKGKLYGFDARVFGSQLNPEISVHINNPFSGEQESYSAKLGSDGSYEIQVPMTAKHQVVFVSVRPIISNSVLLSAGKTVVLDYDFKQVYTPWELADRRLTPYFSGENVDVNYALDQNFGRAFYRQYINGSIEIMKKIANFSMSEYKQYILNAYDDFCKQVDVASVTKRAKELLKINMRCECAYLLSMGTDFIEDSYRQANGKKHDESIPDFKRPVADDDYWNYPQLLHLDDIMMFYADRYDYNIYGWNMNVEDHIYEVKYYDEVIGYLAQLYKDVATTDEDKQIAASVAQKLLDKSNSWTAEEKDYQRRCNDAVTEKMNAKMKSLASAKEQFINKILGNGNSYIKDFIKLQGICREHFAAHSIVPDSLINEVEKMRFPFYANYIRNRNAANLARIEAEKQRGGYFEHKASDSEGDALLVDLIKDFKGKVVFIDFWNTWCVPCRQAINEMRPMEELYEGKDVVFLFLADDSSPIDAYNGMIPTMKGHHYRLTGSQMSSLKKKWDFTGIPSYVIIGKDGTVKDFHTTFHGVEYYKRKIDDELSK